jgi:hypothetical protein
VQRSIELRAVYPEVLFNLARAFAATQQFELAVRAAITAQAQADEMGKTDLLAAIRDQLRIYRAALKP